MRYSIGFDEILYIFSQFAYYYDHNELFWYRYMWSLLEKHKLTQYVNDTERYYVILRATALIYMFYGYVSAIEDDNAFPHDIYENALIDEIPEFELGQLYGRLCGDGQKDECETDKSYAVFALAQTEHHAIISAVLKELTHSQLLQTLLAINYEEEHTLKFDDGEEYIEELPPQSYEEYMDLVTNRLDDINIGDDRRAYNAYVFVVENGAYFNDYE